MLIYYCFFHVIINVILLFINRDADAIWIFSTAACVRLRQSTATAAAAASTTNARLSSGLQRLSTTAIPASASALLQSGLPVCTSATLLIATGYFSRVFFRFFPPFQYKVA